MRVHEDVITLARAGWHVCIYRRCASGVLHVLVALSLRLIVAQSILVLYARGIRAVPRLQTLSESAYTRTIRVCWTASRSADRSRKLWRRASPSVHALNGRQLLRTACRRDAELNHLPSWYGAKNGRGGACLLLLLLLRRNEDGTAESS